MRDWKTLKEEWVRVRHVFGFRIVPVMLWSSL